MTNETIATQHTPGPWRVDGAYIGTEQLSKSCGCYQDATKAHIKKVLKEINQS